MSGSRFDRVYSVADIAAIARDINIESANECSNTVTAASRDWDAEQIWRLRYDLAAVAGLLADLADAVHDAGIDIQIGP